MIAQELALAYPALVDRLVLFATLARPRRAIFDPLLAFVVQATERLDATAVAMVWLPLLYSPAFLAQPDQVEAALAWQEPYPRPRTASPPRRRPCAPTTRWSDCPESPRRRWCWNGAATPRSGRTRWPGPRRCWRSSPADAGGRGVRRHCQLVGRCRMFAAPPR